MDAITLAERYVALWNEAGAARRRQGIEALWAPSGRHLVGQRVVAGYDALETRISESHARNVTENGHAFVLGAVHSAQDAIMLDWTMIAPGRGAVLASGRDMLIVDAELRIFADYQFIIG